MKGMRSSPAASSVASRRSGVLSGAPRWQSRSSRSDSIIIPWLGATGPQRGELVGEQRAGVGVGEQAGLVEHELGHRGEVVDGRARSRASASHSAGDRVALLGPLARA